MFIIRIFILICFFHQICLADLPNETVYLTWQNDPASTMTIQWLSLPEDESSTIHYRNVEDSCWQTVEGLVIKFPQSTNYLIHRTELTGLKPEGNYFFQFCSKKQIYLFQTMPSDLTRSIRFVVGGDMYHDSIDLMIEMCHQAAKTNPDFALLGGDIAYSVNSSSQTFQHIDRWVQWVKAWSSSMVTEKGKLIPVIAAVGNHDVTGHFDQTPAQAKVFSSLFPMPGERIYNVLDFNKYLSIWILDSGHANSIAGAQTQWLKQTMDSRQDVKHRFAIYHVPAYPSVRDMNNKYSSDIRRHWVPLFENGGLHTAFENHDHAYKRTYPLLKNKVHEKGTVYLGDGAWGVEKPRMMKCRKIPFFMAKFAALRHVTVVTLSPDDQHYISIDNQGKKIDEYFRSLEILPPENIEELETQEEGRVGRVSNSR